MPAAPKPRDETARLAALRALDVLDAAPDAELDALVEAAALICRRPISLISLVDEDRQWFRANVGLDGVAETPRAWAFCAYAIHNDVLLEVGDATRDPRFADNPLVTGQPEIRFYAGMPLVLASGTKVGTLCVFDREPGQLEPAQRLALQALARVATLALERRQRDRHELARLSADSLRLASVVRTTTQAVLMTDTEARVCWINPAFTSLTGFQLADVLGADLHTLLLAPNTDPEVAAAVDAALSLHQGCRVETTVTRKDGGIGWVDLEVQAIPGPHGEFAGVVALQSDISARKSQETQREADRRRLAAIIEGTGAGTWEWNVQTGETRFNARWAEIIGARLDDLAPISIQTWLEAAHPADLERSGEALQRHFRGETEAYECESRMRHRDGRWVWVLDRGRVLTRTADGQPEWMFGTQLDITEVKDREAALHRSEAMLQKAGELSNVGGWELDLDGAAPIWSAQTCRIHGVPPGYRPSMDEAINFYAPEARPLILQAVERGLATGEPWDLELPFIRATGERIWVRSMGSPELSNGVALRLVGAFQDVTVVRAQRLAIEEARATMALAIDSGQAGVWHIDVGTGVAHWDEWVFRQYGRQPLGRPVTVNEWLAWVHVDDGKRVLAELKDAAAGNPKAGLEFRAVWPDGSTRFLRSAVRPIRDEADVVRRLVGLNWDVTPQRLAEDALRRERELLQVTLNSIGDAVITTNAERLITWLNPVAERLTGWTGAEARGRPLAQVFRIVHEDSRETVIDPVETCIAERRIVGLAAQTLLISRDGEEHGIEDSAAPITDVDGAILGAVLVFHDVTEQRRLSSEMRYRATHDALTQLVNREEFEASVQRAYRDASNQVVSHSLMVIDLDRFKIVNDTCGHAAGDRLLQQVAKLMQETVRSRDLLARLGGDEFGVLLERCTPEQAQRVAQLLCDRLDAYRFEHDGQRFRIGASIGISPLDAGFASMGEAMQAADSACYAAKEAGRNRVHLWEDRDVSIRARRGESQWATRIEQALDEGHFELFAQRIVPLTHVDERTHLEVLLRLRNVDGTLLSPGAFLPAAERFHLVSRIDRWVLAQVAGLLGDACIRDQVALVAINLSGQSIGDRAFHRHAVELLEGAGQQVCQRLCLEITETAAVTNMADASLFVERLRALGVRIALDDFGAGASSFGYLKSLRVDLLKVDEQFIRDLPDDPLDEAAVRSFVEVARVLGVQTVAEFVDRPEVLARVREMGIHHAQGYLLHQPEPWAQALARRLPPQ